MNLDSQGKKIFSVFISYTVYTDPDQTGVDVFIVKVFVLCSVTLTVLSFAAMC